MFDISFTELALCFVVALVVLGPERLPKVARTVGRWTGQAKSYMRNLTSELERETQVGEIRRQIQEAQRSLRESTQAIEQSTRKLAGEVRDEIRPPDSAAPPAAAAPAAIETPTPREPDAKP